MNRMPCLSSIRVGAVLAMLALVACATSSQQMDSTPQEPARMPALRVAQQGHGSAAQFALCRGTACPAPTPKSRIKSPVQRAPDQAAPVSSDASLEMHSRAAHLHGASAHAQNDRQSTNSLLSLHFPFASARLDAAARAALRDALPRLTAAPGLALVGHTDHTGPAAANERLARARADAVLQALRSLAPGHVFHARIDARGTCCFAASNDTPAGRARNRRVDIHLGLDPEDAP